MPVSHHMARLTRQPYGIRHTRKEPHRRTQRLRPSTLLIAGLATAGLALSACGSDSLSESTSSSSSSSTTQATVDPALVAKLPEKIKSAGKIVVGTDATYQPNEYLDADGKTVIGMDVDLFNAVMAKFGIKTEWS